MIIKMVSGLPSAGMLKASLKAWVRLVDPINESNTKYETKNSANQLIVGTITSIWLVLVKQFHDFVRCLYIIQDFTFVCKKDQSNAYKKKHKRKYIHSMVEN